MPPEGTVTVAQNPEDLRAKVKAQTVEGKPTFFKLEAQLPKQGRTDTPLAASDKMWVVLKTYAADGENGLHAHPNEDHTFVVLQGEATFYGPNGESSPIGRNEGVLLPHGTFYWFKATSEEPLVMVRVGAAAFDGVDRHGRIAPDGSEMRGDSVENKQVELIMSDRWFRQVVSDADRHSGAWRQTPSAYFDPRPARGLIAPPRSLYLAMPDGCRLAVDVYLPPEAPSRVSAILIFTPYYRRFALRADAPAGTKASPGVARWRDLFVPRGYALVAVDVRGHRRQFRHTRQLPLAARAR